MRTIIYIKKTKKIIECRDYHRFSYPPITEDLVEVPFIFDDNLDISTPKYFVAQQITFEPPLPV